MDQESKRDSQWDAIFSGGPFERFRDFFQEEIRTLEASGFEEVDVGYIGPQSEKDTHTTMVRGDKHGKATAVRRESVAPLSRQECAKLVLKLKDAKLGVMNHYE